ncbi:MAG: PDZ domain-containing protein [Ginsengibacter sp.]
MKKNIFFTAIVMAGIMLSGNSWAQDAPKAKKSEEIIIRKNDNVDKKMIIEIDGDKVTVNGKPLSEFHDGDVTIMKNDMRDRGSNNFLYAPDNMEMQYDLNDMGDAKPRPFLGVSSTKGDEGAKITEIVKGSAAEKAGLLSGDVITKIDDKKVESPEELMDVVKAHKPGEEVKVYYLRDTKKKDTKAKLGETKMNKRTMVFKGNPGMNGNDFNFKMPNMQNRLNRNFNFMYDNADKPKIGIKIEDTENGDGVKILNVEEGSPADKAGLKKDDVITSFNGNKINSVGEIMEKLDGNPEKENMDIKARRNNAEMSFEVKIPKKLNSADL